MHLTTSPQRIPSAVFFFVLVVSVLWQVPVYAAQPDYSEEDHALVGLELVYESGLYHGQDGYIYPDFYLDARQGDFFAKGQTLGYDMFVGPRASLSIAITRDDTFLDVSSIDDDQKELFYGIEDRKRAIETGLIYKYRSRVALVTFEYFKDYFDSHRAHRTVTRITRPIPNNQGLQIEPSLFVEYHSQEFNEYYYQVTRAENRTAAKQSFGVLSNTTLRRYRKDIRDEYKPGNSAHWGVDVRVTYPLADNLSLTGYFSFMDITGPVFRSPLVEDRKFYQSKLGLAYTF